jgi:hypothetical protein
VPGRNGEDDLVLDERLELERAVTPDRADHAELELALGDLLDDGLRVGDGKRHVESQVRALELAQEERNEVRPRPGRGADGEGASQLAVLSARLCEQFLLQPEEALGAAIDPQAGLGRFHPPPRPVDKTLADALLERTHLEADGRLRDPELLCRLGEAALVHDRAKCRQLARVHKQSLSTGSA